jgi:hypothetical protein
MEGQKMEFMLIQMHIGNILIEVGRKATSTHIKAAERVVAFMDKTGATKDAAIAAVLLKHYNVTLTD